MDLKEQELLGDGAHLHWYYRAKSAAMLRMLGHAPIDSVLDVGAGTGFFSRVLLSQTGCREAICIDPNYVMESSDVEANKPIRFVRSIDRFDGNLVLMMDVLEHVQDDVALLGDYAAKVPPRTRFLITVPAMPWMWSAHDVFLEHYRRYTIGRLDRAIECAGLHRRSICYYFGLTLPLAFAVRFGRRLLRGRSAPYSDMQAHSPVVNALLLRICEAELTFFTHNRLGGLSALAIAESD